MKVFYHQFLSQLLGGKIDVENVPLISVNEEDILKN